MICIDDLITKPVTNVQQGIYDEHIEFMEENDGKLLFSKNGLLSFYYYDGDLVKITPKNQLN